LNQAIVLEKELHNGHVSIKAAAEDTGSNPQQSAQLCMMNILFTGSDDRN
jgi:hypothetical protein